MSDYVDQVAEAYLKFPAGFYGDAAPTPAEQVAQEQLGLSSTVEPEAYLRHVEEHGVPLPDKVSASDVALAAGAHACGVALHLADVRGPQGAVSTFRSYVTKNAFDREVGRNMRALQTPAAIHNWEQPVAREDGYENPNIVYPRNVDIRFVHGVAAPHRYLPAQTARHMLFAKLGILEPATAEKMGIADLNEPSLFRIPWDIIKAPVANAADHVKLSGELGAAIAKQLLANGLSTEQVSAILDKSYSIRGIQEEHGKMPEAKAVRESLAHSLRHDGSTRRVEIDA